MKAADWLLFGLVTLTALILGALHLCPFDWIWAAATVGVVVFWAWMLSRKRSEGTADTAPPRDGVGVPSAHKAASNIL